MTKRVVIAVIFLVIWTILIQTNNIGWFDEPIYNFLISFEGYFLTRVMKIFSFFACDKFFAALCVLFILCILWKRFDSLYLMCTLFFAAGFNLILKDVFRRIRPDHLRLVTETGYSYPSGHAMASMAFYGAILVLVKHSDTKYKKVIFISTAILIFLIGVSRVYLGVHYPSDVIGGWVWAYLILVVLDYIVGGIREGIIKWR